MYTNRLFIWLLLATIIGGGYAHQGIDTSQIQFKSYELRPFIDAKSRRHRSAGMQRPHIPSRIGTSLNWAGYAIYTPTLWTVTGVQGSWVVPTVRAPTHPADDTYCSLWIGIDGYSSNSVEQIGTEHDWDGAKGAPHHYAWFEMYPAYPVEIVGFPVETGDIIYTAIEYLGNGQFKFMIINQTKNTGTTIPEEYTRGKPEAFARNSAEWILEAPFSDKVLPLADVTNVVGGASGPVPFAWCIATTASGFGGINGTGLSWQGLNMETKNKIMKASVSPLSQDGTAFAVMWAHE